AALSGPAILHLGDVRDRGLEDGNGVAGDVAFPATADKVRAKPEPGSLGGHGAIVPEHAVRLADARAQLYLTADGVQHEMPILRRAVDEVLSLLPLLPAVDPADLEDVRGTARSEERRVGKEGRCRGSRE